MRLGCERVSVRFGAFTAVDSVSLGVEPGEVLAIVGENGAGKSTLMNALFGLLAPSEGSVVVDDARVSFNGAQDAIRAGIGMVHQHFRLVGNLTVAENIALGHEPRRGVAFDRAKATSDVVDLAAKLGFALDANAVVEDLSVGAQQRVEIAKALARGARTLILDEPTAVLTPQEVDDLFRMVRALVAAGTAVLFISHKLDEVKEIASRIAVMRAGKLVDTVSSSSVSPKEIARLMVGRDIGSSREVRASQSSSPPSPPRPQELGCALQLENICVGRALDHVSLEVKAGEILGVAGVEGNGQAELVEVCAGLAPPRAGRVRFGDVDVTALTPRRRFALGLAHIAGDRLRDGVAASMSVEENAILGRHRELRREMHGTAQKIADDYDVRPRDVTVPLRSLSGGNQQKVVVGRELGRQPKILLAAHPTRGVDVGAVETIHARLLDERNRGAAILLISSDLNELLALSDRVVVLYRGKIVHEVSASETDPRKLGVHMLGAA